eukprot:6502128-Karenia_brevis.AAC.1
MAPNTLSMGDHTGSPLSSVTRVLAYPHHEQSVPRQKWFPHFVSANEPSCPSPPTMVGRTAMHHE